MTSFLNERFFQLSKREKFIAILATSLFFSLFMLFFQPFGVNNYDPKEEITPLFTITMFGLGVLVFIILLVNELLIFPVIFKNEVYKWQILLWLLWTNVYAATFIFFAYNYLGGWHDFHWKSWFEFIGNFTTVSIIPLVAIYFYAKVKQVQHRSETSIDHEKEGIKIIQIPSENQSEIKSFALENLLYLEPEDNYVAVHYLHQGKEEKTLVRTTLKKIEDLNPHPALFRCHRSFTINLFHLANYEGNNQQGFIKLNHVAKPIPVSRSYAPDLVLQLK